jgi:hypothetical protein
MGDMITRLYCPTEFLDSFLNIANHQFYRESSLLRVPLLKGVASALARDSGERPSAVFPYNGC